MQILHTIHNIIIVCLSRLVQAREADGVCDGAGHSVYQTKTTDGKVDRGPDGQGHVSRTRRGPNDRWCLGGWAGAGQHVRSAGGCYRRAAVD